MFDEIPSCRGIPLAYTAQQFLEVLDIANHKKIEIFGVCCPGSLVVFQLIRGSVISRDLLSAISLKFTIDPAGVSGGDFETTH
jgi:hypothetical protein